MWLQKFCFRIKAPLSRQPLVKGERLVRNETSAAMCVQGAPNNNRSEMTNKREEFHNAKQGCRFERLCKTETTKLCEVAGYLHHSPNKN